ncbi:hypothetical protein ACFLW2_01510 [Chloroflexota bacterium]
MTIVAILLLSSVLVPLSQAKAHYPGVEQHWLEEGFQVTGGSGSGTTGTIDLDAVEGYGYFIGYFDIYVVNGAALSCSGNVKIKLPSGEYDNDILSIWTLNGDLTLKEKVGSSCSLNANANLTNPDSYKMVYIAILPDESHPDAVKASLELTVEHTYSDAQGGDSSSVTLPNLLYHPEDLTILAHEAPTAVYDTHEFPALTSDGQLYYSDTYYEDAHDEDDGWVLDTPNHLKVGQAWYAYWYYTYYSVFRGGLYFDTSALPEDVEISSAYLRLHVESNYAPSSDKLVVVDGYDLNKPNMVSEDYGQLENEGDDTHEIRGSISSISISASLWYSYGNISIFLQPSTFDDDIDRSGTTRYALRTQKDIDEQAPGYGLEYIIISSAESAYPPVLQVTLRIWI